MARNLIILAALVGIVYFVMKKLTVYRCPRCASVHITKLKEHNYESSERVYFCSRCRAVFTKKKPLN